MDEPNTFVELLSTTAKVVVALTTILSIIAAVWAFLSKSELARGALLACIVILAIGAIVLLWKNDWVYNGIITLAMTIGFAIIFWNQLRIEANMNSQFDLIQRDLECYVLPRSVSAEQAETLIDFLSRHEPQDYQFRVLQGDEEAGGFRADLQRALQQAGWHMTGIDYANDVREGGVKINVMESKDHRAMRSNGRPDAPKLPDEYLKEALMLAGVPMSGGSRGSGQDAVGYNLTIEIGKRRRDRGWCDYQAEVRIEQERKDVQSNK